MSAGETAVLIASVLTFLAVGGLLVALRSLRRETRRLAAVCDDLRRQTVPLVVDAHRVVGQAASEMERVGAVLDSTESVHATVDSASKLAYRAFANPVVKVLAVRAGAASGLRRLRTGPETTANGSTTNRTALPPTDPPPTDRAPTDRAPTDRAPTDRETDVIDRAQEDLLSGGRGGHRGRLHPVGRAQDPTDGPGVGRPAPTRCPGGGSGPIGSPGGRQCRGTGARRGVVRPGRDEETRG